MTTKSSGHFINAVSHWSYVEMNEPELFQIIAKGECEYIDFKRELNLQSSKQKAEFIKDTIALANSTKDKGYLLIGVGDDKVINGTNHLQEEQIQQVIQTYVTPIPRISIDMVPVLDAGFKTVGVIVITPTSKPHIVARGIEMLKKDDSFIRRGSTTSSLTASDLVAIFNESGKLKSETKNYVEAGKRHFSLENYPLAIKSFSKAIELSPEPELFFWRGQAYQEDLKERKRKAHAPLLTGDELEELASCVYKDFNDAIHLSPSPEFELEVRKARYYSRSLRTVNYTDEQRYEDFVAIKESLLESERAEWVIDSIDEVHIRWDEHAVNELEELLGSGYKTSKLFRLLIEVQTDVVFNYGKALKLADEALERFKDEEESINRFLSEKADLLLRMKKYDEALRVIQALKRRGQTIWRELGDNEEDILIRIALMSEVKHDIEPIESILANVLMLYFSRQLGNRLSDLDKRIPGLLKKLEKLVGKENFWAIMNVDEGYTLQLQFPAIDKSTTFH